MKIIDVKTIEDADKVIEYNRTMGGIGYRCSDDQLKRYIADGIQRLVTSSKRVPAETAGTLRVYNEPTPVDTLLGFMNHGDVDEGIFAVAEVSQEDVNNWLTDILRDDYGLSLAFWTHNELVVTTVDGTSYTLGFNGERWALKTDATKPNMYECPRCGREFGDDLDFAYHDAVCGTEDDDCDTES